jgi:GNAT superfamily N-acetyltransferase
MIDPVVRPARRADVDALQMLEDEARAGLDEARGGVRWLEEHPPIGSRWAEVVAARSVFVAEIGDVEGLDQPPAVVGYLVLDVDGEVARIDQVFVTPGARELGFGDALVEAATDVARSASATYLEGEALPGDRDTKNLFERARITARLITVSRRLD